MYVIIHPVLGTETMPNRKASIFSTVMNMYWLPCDFVLAYVGYFRAHKLKRVPTYICPSILGVRHQHKSHIEQIALIPPLARNIYLSK